MGPRQRPGHPILGIAVALLVWGAALEAQSPARLRVSENFRSLPNQEILARLASGTTVTVVGGEEEWREVEVEGWVWTRSLQVVARGALDLVVAAEGGENLRSEPRGPILGRLEEGTLLEELERRPGWIRARRRGWIWAPSLSEPEPEARVSTEGDGAVSGADGQEAPPEPAPVEVVRTGGEGVAVLGAPGGDTLAITPAGSELAVTAREGSWARVRIEGWVWLPASSSALGEPGDGPAELKPGDLRDEPDRHRGRVVTWPLEFISLEEAERVRTDFFEGERFLLTRYGGSDGPFVYVAVPGRFLERAEGLTPLEALTVTGRVRTGASSLTGTPILDLMELVRAAGAP